MTQKGIQSIISFGRIFIPYKRKEKKLFQVAALA
jgi:hypothetical protein